jgi:hypothetical protein
VSRAERITGPTVRANPLGVAIRPFALARERVLPLAPAIGELFPSGLRRGSTVAVCVESPAPCQGSTSLALALAAAASAGGSWCAIVGCPDLGLVAAAELGIALERLALVPVVPAGQWVTVVGALLDAVDIVIARPLANLRQGDARRLTTRARERDTVLIPILAGGRRSGPWSDGADIRLTVMASRWEGPGSGDGHLQARHLEVSSVGRGAAGRPRRVDLLLPAATGWLPAATGRLGPVLRTAYAGSDAHLLPDPTDRPDRTDRTRARPEGVLRSAG